MAPSSSNKKVTNGIVALSSAAILAVYGAGYTKTRDAADRMAARADEWRQRAEARRQLAAGTGQANVARAEPLTAAGSAQGQLAAGAEADAPAVSRVEELATPEAASAPNASQETKAPATGTAPDAAAPTASAPATPSASTPATASPAAARSLPPRSEPAGSSSASDESNSDAARAASSATTAGAPAVSPAQASGEALQSAQQAPAPVPEAPTVATGRYKDGTYYGWGSCRHGDIQAMVVVQAGRITTADVAQCLTRYSCGWIEPIPPTIIKAQNTTYDYVSGATDSSDAFQSAVADALSAAQ